MPREVVTSRVSFFRGSASSHSLDCSQRKPVSDLSKELAKNQFHVNPSMLTGFHLIVKSCKVATPTEFPADCVAA